MQFRDRAGLRVLRHGHAFDDVGIAQADFLAGEETVVLGRGDFAEVVALDVNLARKRHLPRTGCRIFRIVHGIEFLNLTAAPIDLGGWYLSNTKDNLKKYRIPAGTQLPANGYAVLYEVAFNAGTGGNVAFTFNSAHGDTAHLSQADGSGTLTGYRCSVAFPAAAHGVSFGRYATSVGVDFVPMSATTFGADAPATLTQFRTGTGLPNAAPRVGPLVINELMYHPPSVVGTNDNSHDEFVELLNITPSPVTLYDPDAPTNTWSIHGGIDFTFPQNVTCPAGGVLLVVPFDPVADTASLVNLRTLYGISAQTPVFGPYSGKLNNFLETVRLVRPDPPQTPPHPDVGFVPQIILDEITYSNIAPWPPGADGTGDSLQRITPSLYGNDPANWTSAAPTAGSPNNLGGGTPPTILSQPASQVLVQGGTANLEVIATGTPAPSYQWSKEGIDIPGATTSTLTLGPLLPSDTGNYTVRVSNPSGKVLSAAATLTVEFPPTITLQPTPLTVTSGSPASFSVAASGLPAPAYQWRKDGVDIPGATSPSLNLPAVSTTDAGTYSVRVTNPHGTVTSLGAPLTVETPPAITLQPKPVEVVEGGAATFEIVASGTPPPIFQWLRDGVPVIGGTASTLVVSPVHRGDAGLYSVRVTGAGVEVGSEGAQLTVLFPVKIDSIQAQPDGSIWIDASGPVPSTLELQVSTDLTTWSTVATQPAPSGQTRFTDPAPQQSQRFYRVRRP